MNLAEWIEDQRDKFIALSDQIWDFAELGFSERRSSDLLAAALKGAGFRLQRGVADIPTAFIASFGQRRPVIAILGEYDALPGLSQEKVPFRKPLAENGNGHGCGHNLLGVGSLAANVVPPLAESQYIIRAPLLQQVNEIYPRVLDSPKARR